MVVGDFLAARVHRNRSSYVEIGSQHADVFYCVSHFARSSTLYEADKRYCRGIHQRFSHPSPNIALRCPSRFPDAGHVDADFYYAWMVPEVAIGILAELRRAVRMGLVRDNATFLHPSLPFASHYAQTGASPVHLWEDVDLTRFAKRIHPLPFAESAFIGSQRTPRFINSTVLLLEFDLRGSGAEEKPPQLTKHQCAAPTYSADGCPAPSEALARRFDWLQKKFYHGYEPEGPGTGATASP